MRKETAMTTGSREKRIELLLRLENQAWTLPGLVAELVKHLREWHDGMLEAIPSLQARPEVLDWEWQQAFRGECQRAAGDRQDLRDRLGGLFGYPPPLASTDLVETAKRYSTRLREEATL
jgi:hypothetical protein